MHERVRAEAHLRAIRRLMERATIYRAISAPTAFVSGLLAVAASGFEWSRPGALSLPSFIALWLAVLAASLVFNTILLMLRARRRGEPLVSAGMKMALLAVLPPVCTAAVITAVAPDTFTLAVSWAVLYGLALLATAHFAPKSLIILGWAFLATGLAALFCDEIFARFESHRAAMIMGLTFGLYHLSYAALTWSRAGKVEVDESPEPQ
jgi:hypothetical protein